MDDLDVLSSLSTQAPPPPPAFLRAVRNRRIARRVRLAGAVIAPAVVLAAIVAIAISMHPPAATPIVTHESTPPVQADPTAPTLRSLDIANRGVDLTHLKLPTPSTGGAALRPVTLRDRSLVRDLGF